MSKLNLLSPILASLSFLLFFFSNTCISFGQDSTEQKNILFSINDEHVTIEEFQYHYQKKVMDSSSKACLEDVQDYLDKYIDFKLKVHEAYLEKRDSSLSFQEEYAAFQKKIEDLYIYRHEVTPALLKEAYERTQFEVKASHILINLPRNASPEDSLMAYDKIKSIRKKINQGLSFEDAAKRYSEGPSSSFGGNLGYFSALQMVYPFENAAFQTAVGSISEIVRTDFGFHILKVFDKKKKDSIPLFPQIEEELKAKILKDSRSAISMESLMVQLKKENNYIDQTKNQSKLFKKLPMEITMGNWSPSPSYKKKWNKKTLFSIGELDYSGTQFIDFIEENQQAFPNKDLHNLIKQYFDQFITEEMIAYERTHLLSKYPEIQWQLQEYKEGSLFFSIMEDKIWNTSSFSENKLKSYYEVHIQDFQTPVSADVTIFNAGSKEILERVKHAVNHQLYEVFPSDVMIMHFKRNGYGFSSRDRRDLLKIARLMKADTSLHLNMIADKYYFEKNWAAPKRIEAVKNYLVRNGVKKGRINNEIVSTKTSSKRYGGKVHFHFFRSDLSKLSNSLNDESPDALKISEEKIVKGNHPILDQTAWTLGQHEIKYQERFYLIQIHEIFPPSPYPFEKVRMQITQAYQKQLEEEWIKELRNKYNVIIQESNLEKVCSDHSNVNNRLR